MIKELKYLVIYEKSWGVSHPINVIIPDGADTDLDSALSWAEEVSEDIIEKAVHVLNRNDFWRGYFYFNDSEEPEEACPLELNSREHLDDHWETNNSGGHYDCTKYEHIVNGEIIETINHTNE